MDDTQTVEAMNLDIEIAKLIGWTIKVYNTYDRFLKYEHVLYGPDSKEYGCYRSNFDRMQSPDYAFHQGWKDRTLTRYSEDLLLALELPMPFKFGFYLMFNKGHKAIARIADFNSEKTLAKVIHENPIFAVCEAWKQWKLTTVDSNI